MPPETSGLLLVHAHPDDEAVATGGLIARSLAEGRRVDLVTCTGGEEGEIHDPTLDPADALPRLHEIRARELQCALDALRSDAPGTLELHMLGYRDSGMMGTEPNRRPDVFWNADLDEATGRLVEIVRWTRPAAMVSYDANGNYGHPDHINAHRIAAAAWDAAGDASRFPEAGEPHAVERFYEIAFNRERWTSLMAAMMERGIKLPWGNDAAEESAEEGAGEEPEEWGMPEEKITTTVDVADWTAQKRACMDCHRTQRQDMGWLLDLPPDLAAEAFSPEYFVLTRWRDREVPDGYRETSVF
jgi:N-acetyl-1-D-myo-inositol-2-amino-2-deoxy-alpha-D-glucopyranoside deacetylase